MSKSILISIIIAGVLIGGVLVIGKNSQTKNDVLIDNVKIIDGKQIIEIKAKGGYFPEKSIAKAGLPTIIRFDSVGTFDCSSFVRIPQKDISQNLSSSGMTEVDLGVPEVGKLQGMCNMGMYPFEIEFQ